ncbi:DNA-binding transcriptional activator of the SARP family [Sinosporangium album]|uniref:DNA-binding transcriptional activator of the SARP family n=1 Tax=Sinosporangium album TaxID=504805 RepID=A0A1G7Z229_9ACTN|nr:tetratricopeptide repeat protein [Sinosporangium album]SDH02821.1 DNA-binding transcriptional activator of the SARP family [Sinosporangium album]
MLFRLLSPSSGIELSVEGQEHPLYPPIQQVLLALLLVRVGRAITVGQIVDQIWGEDAPMKARENLKAHVSRLRSWLRGIVGDRVQIVHKGGTYTARVPPECIDLHVVRRRQREAKAVLEAGDVTLALRLLREAEELWQGEALAGLPGAWAMRMAESLDGERRDLRRDRIELELRLGHHAEVLAELQQSMADHPIDETVAKQLMIALYRSSRQADALRVYREINRHLREHLAMRPGSALDELHQRILHGDAELAVTPVYHRGGGDSQPDTLPADVPYFTGRAREIEVVDGLRAERGNGLSVVLQGMAGVGKTALAVHLAYRFAGFYPDARLYLDLRGHDRVSAPLDASGVLLAALRMLGIPATRVPLALAERAAMWHAEMAYRRAIMVLDDASGFEQVKPLLVGARNVLTLVTTRSRFEVEDGVVVVPVDVLPDAEAAELVRRVVDRSAGAGADVVERVVRFSGGLPLAITLRAGSLGGPVERSHGLPGFDSGHQQINAAFDLSYRGLTVEAQSFFRRLGLNPCRDITVPTAAVLSGFPIARAAWFVDVLVKHHLLKEMRDGRFRFHDLVRLYAYDRTLREDSGGDRRRAMERLLNHYVRSTEKAAFLSEGGQPPDGEVLAPGFGFTDATSAKRWLEEEWGNVLLLADYAASHEWKAYCVRLTHEMCEFLDAEGRWAEAVAACEQALQACRELGDARGVAVMLLELGRFRYRVSRRAEAIQLIEEARRTYIGLGDRRGEARTLDRIGLVNMLEGKHRMALAYTEEASALFRTVGDAGGEAGALAHCGLVNASLGRYTQALELLEQALVAYRAIRDRRGEGETLNNLADIQSHRGYHRDAVALYEQSLQIFKEIPGRQNLALLDKNLGEVYQYKGDHQRALEYFTAAIATFQNSGDRYHETEVLICLGRTYLEMGAPDESMIFFEKARDIAEVIDRGHEKAWALVGIADVNYARGRYRPALDLCQAALDIARDGGDDLYQEAQVHKRMGDISHCLQEPSAARISWRQALGIFESLDLPDAEEIRIKLDALE